MKSKDMRVGMHVGIGTRHDEITDSLREAYILVLPNGRMSRHGRWSTPEGEQPKGMVGVAVKSPVENEWYPRWVPSAEVRRAVWPIYAEMVAKRRRARQENQRKRAASQERAREAARSVVASLESVGVYLSGDPFASYGGAFDLSVSAEGYSGVIKLDMSKVKDLADRLRRLQDDNPCQCPIKHDAKCQYNASKLLDQYP